MVALIMVDIAELNIITMGIYHKAIRHVEQDAEIIKVECLAQALLSK